VYVLKDILKVELIMTLEAMSVEGVWRESRSNTFSSCEEVELNKIRTTPKPESNYGWP
jgi:hypothetical protein